MALNWVFFSFHASPYSTEDLFLLCKASALFQQVSRSLKEMWEVRMPRDSQTANTGVEISPYQACPLGPTHIFCSEPRPPWP